MVKQQNKGLSLSIYFAMDVDTLASIQVLLSNTEMAILNVADEDGNQYLCEKMWVICHSIICVLNEFIGDDTDETSSPAVDVSLNYKCDKNWQKQEDSHKTCQLQTGWNMVADP